MILKVRVTILDYIPKGYQLDNRQQQALYLFDNYDWSARCIHLR